MDLVKEIRETLRANASSQYLAGLESVLAHIEIAERYHLRAKKERDEHLYTDVIYRTNHAFEGILKEAYLTLAEKPADKITPYEIEAYLLESNVLRSRVVDLLKNYRQEWRNPSTHDHKLFFSEQESFLAIVTVSAFVSILLDQILEKLAYIRKSKELDSAAIPARDRIKNFEKLSSIDKVQRILASFADHFIKNYSTMSVYSMNTANAQMAAFIKKVAPDMNVELEPEITLPSQRKLQLDLLVHVGTDKVVVDTHEPDRNYYPGDWLDDSGAINRLSEMLYMLGLQDGIVFYYPRKSDDEVITTTTSSMWLHNLNLRVIHSVDPVYLIGENFEEPANLVDE